MALEFFPRLRIRQLVSYPSEVDRGMLKRSGYVNDLPNGVEIGYRADYASAVERGRRESPITGTQIVHVPTFTRKDGTVVRAHDVKHVNKRVIRIRPRLSAFEFGKPIYRVISKISATTGQWFLRRAVQEGIKSLGQDVKFCLQRIGKVS